MDKTYQGFLESKAVCDAPTGKQCSPEDCHKILFDFQRLIVPWAVKRGRAALFEDCGLGKTIQQLEWARLVDENTLIVAPLAVSTQTIREAKKLGIVAKYARTQEEVDGQFTITNYERVSKFDPTRFGAVVLDESSILKGFDSKTRSLVTEMFSQTPYRLCCTATPAPNDHAELANHAEFLGVMKGSEMLATFFVHDQKSALQWRLKGHAGDEFWRWVCSWAVCIRKPSDIGCDDGPFVLPPLRTKNVIVKTGFRQQGTLLGSSLSGIQGRIAARRGTVRERVVEAAKMVNGSSDQWIVWCGLNSESEQLAASIPDSVEVKGNDDAQEKAQSLLDFADGKIRVLVTKPSIGGFGMNFQRCHNQAFVGLSDSFEELYQAVRRCWRFGQKKAVNVFLVTADVEYVVVSNIKRKEEEADKMQQAMVNNMRNIEREQIRGQVREKMEYKRDTATGDGWTLNLGDTCEITPEMDDDSVDFSICSPPFASLFTYTASDRDMGNSKDAKQFFEHYKFLIGHWLRVTKPGRLAAVHVAQIPAMLARDGFIGLKNFRDDVVRAHLKAGWIFHGDVSVDKNPQAQAIRTKSKGLMFVQLEKDATWMRPALADYILLFRKPGENKVPVKPDVTREQWIEYAHPCWYGIQETNTLNVAEAREQKDERHICPLQLDLIDRAVRLWSNRGELVFSPFAGIGSEGYQSILNGRRFIGNELKEQYFKVAVSNLHRAMSRRSKGVFFRGQLQNELLNRK
jgi:DNA modification methylase/superfamily II DNA or RNA helicase